MIHEIAIDPRDLGRWQTYSYFVDDCGAERGRLIADLPNGWRKMVLAAATNHPDCRDIERQKIEYHLQHTCQPKLWSRGRGYVQANTWSENAQAQHAHKPFRCVITNQLPAGGQVIPTDLFDKTNALWVCPPQVNIERSPDQLANIAVPLFELSRAVKFIDPHFAPDHARYRRSFQVFLNELRKRNRNAVVEVHLEFKQTSPARDQFHRICENRLAELIPAGMRVTFTRWRQRRAGIDAHARYVLTDRAGLAYEAGLDAGDAGERTDVYLLSESLRAQHWQEYSREQPAVPGGFAQSALEIVDEIQVLGKI